MRTFDTLPEEAQSLFCQEGDGMWHCHGTDKIPHGHGSCHENAEIVFAGWEYK